MRKLVLVLLLLLPASGFAETIHLVATSPNPPVYRLDVIATIEHATVPVYVGWWLTTSIPGAYLVLSMEGTWNGAPVVFPSQNSAPADWICLGVCGEYIGYLSWNNDTGRISTESPTSPIMNIIQGGLGVYPVRLTTEPVQVPELPSVALLCIGYLILSLTFARPPVVGGADITEAPLNDAIVTPGLHPVDLISDCHFDPSVDVSA